MKFSPSTSFSGSDVQPLKGCVLNIAFSVTDCLELRNAIDVYCISHILSTNVKLVVWMLLNIDNLTWLKLHQKLKKI